MTFRPPKNALVLFRTYALVLLIGVFILCAFLGLARETALRPCFLRCWPLRRFSFVFTIFPA